MLCDDMLCDDMLCDDMYVMICYAMNGSVNVKIYITLQILFDIT